MNLKRWGRDIHEYVQKIEQTFINLLMEDYGISAERGINLYWCMVHGKNCGNRVSGEKVDDHARVCFQCEYRSVTF